MTPTDIWTVAVAAFVVAAYCGSWKAGALGFGLAVLAVVLQVMA